MERKAVGYWRRSDPKQVNNGSADNQQTEIKRLADNKGYEIAEWFSDDAVSAYRRRCGQRPGLSSLVEYVLDHDIDAVLFYDESRVSRQVTDFVEDVWRTIGEAKPDVKFFSVSIVSDEEWDPDDEKIQMRLVFAGEESAQKSRHALKRKKQFLAEHIRPGGKAPFGFDKDGNMYTRNDDAPIVYLIFYLSSWGYPDAKITEFLNTAGVASPKGSSWSASTIDAILNNHMYAGHLAWDVRKGLTNGARRPLNQRILFPNVFDPIVPEHLWEYVHGLRRLKRETKKKFDTPNLFEGVAVCSICGSFLVPKDYSPSTHKGQYVKYVCPKGHGKISRDEFHSVVLKRVQHEWGLYTRQLRATARQTLRDWSHTLEEIDSKFTNDMANANHALENGESKYQHSHKLTLSIAKEGHEHVQNMRIRLQSLMSETKSDMALRRFQSNMWQELRPVELRSIILMMVKTLKVNVVKETISLEFRQSPFLYLEEDVGQLAEDSGSAMGS